MATFVTIGYGYQDGYDRTSPEVRDEAHAHDTLLRNRGADMGSRASRYRCVTMMPLGSRWTAAPSCAQGCRWPASPSSRPQISRRRSRWSPVRHAPSRTVSSRYGRSIRHQADLRDDGAHCTVTDRELHGQGRLNNGERPSGRRGSEGRVEEMGYFLGARQRRKPFSPFFPSQYAVSLVGKDAHGSSSASN